MAALIRLCLILLFVISGAGTARAALVRTEAFERWLQNLEQEAVAEGITPETAQTVLSDVVLDDRVVELDQKQPETTITFEDYVRRIVTPERISEGRRLLRENAILLAEISARYEVQPEVIVALWGVESSFGRNSGDYGIIDSLVTLAYEGRRASFFRKELLNALRILDRQHMPASMLRGSWAGAMGQCQFMPSTYLNYAASYSGSSPDIWGNIPDVFASIANYMSADGWRGGETWGYEVRLKHSIPERETGTGQKHSLAEWGRMGVHGLNGEALPDSPVNASLIEPDGPDGRHFLVHDNFRAFMRWNRSTFFATSVGLLADRVVR